jgi:O-antigen ligase/Tfp pilus assembly protein PilF
VFFFATRGLCASEAPGRSVLSGAVLGTGLAVAYAVMQLRGFDPLRWEAPISFGEATRVFSTQGHPNSLAQLLATSLPVTVYFLVRELQARRVTEALLLALVSAGSVATVLLTVSRAGTLAMAAALAIVAAGAATRTPRARVAALASLGGLALAAGALAMLWDPGQGLTATLQRLAHLDPNLLADEPRRFLWAAAGRAFLDHPLLGVGPDCFSLVYGRYRSPEAWNSEWGLTPLKAHCQPLEVLATRGLAGALAGAVLVFGIGRALLRSTRDARDPLLPVAAFAGLVAFGVHNLFHFPTAAPTLLSLALAALLSRPSENAAENAPPEAKPLRGTLVVAGVVVAVALLYILALRPARADLFCRTSTLLMPADPARAVSYGEKAVRLDPGRDLLWLRLAAAYQSAALAETSPAPRRALLERARETAEKAVRLVPASAFGRAHLATMLADLERETPPLAGRPEVEAAFSQAIALDPNNADILMAAAAAALAAGDVARAEAWAEKCRALYPTYAPSRALLAAARLARAADLAAAGQTAAAAAEREEAIALLRSALEGDWRGQRGAREAARANLERALREGSR